MLKLFLKVYLSWDWLGGVALGTIFFPGLFFYGFIEGSNPENPRRSYTTGPKSNWNPQPQKPNPRPQTTINEQIWEKSVKNTQGKIIACFTPPQIHKL